MTTLLFRDRSPNPTFCSRFSAARRLHSSAETPGGGSSSFPSHRAGSLSEIAPGETGPVVGAGACEPCHLSLNETPVEREVPTARKHHDGRIPCAFRVGKTA